MRWAAGAVAGAFAASELPVTALYQASQGRLTMWPLSWLRRGAFSL